MSWWFADSLRYAPHFPCCLSIALRSLPCCYPSRPTLSQLSPQKCGLTLLNCLIRKVIFYSLQKQLLKWPRLFLWECRKLTACSTLLAASFPSSEPFDATLSSSNAKRNDAIQQGNAVFALTLKNKATIQEGTGQSVPISCTPYYDHIHYMSHPRLLI